MKDLHEIAGRARNAFYAVSVASHEQRNRALLSLAELLTEQRERIFSANRADLDAAGAEQLAAPLLHRLTFGQEKLDQVVRGLHALAELPDPINKTICSTEITDGLKLYRVSSPIGVIGVIFESRPDALIQISSLCIKSGNAVLLKGGREALQTNMVLCDLVREALHVASLPSDAAQLLETREDVANNEGVQHDNEVQNAEPLYLHRNDKHEIHLHFRIYNGKGKEDGNVDVIGAKYVRQLVVEDLQNIELVFVEPLGHKRSVRFSEQGKGHVREEIADAKAKDGCQRR